MPKPTLLNDEAALIRRYLVWCYKTTKEELDRIDRKFTQLVVDKFLLEELRQAEKAMQQPMKKDFGVKVEEFEKYMENKTEAAAKEKFSDAGGKLFTSQYLYLKQRLNAVEKSIKRFLGNSELSAIRSLYEEEMTRRILLSREHS